MKFFDDKCKNVKWWNRNYFYAGTIFIVLLNILLFACGGSDWENVVDPTTGHHWHEVFYFTPTIRVFLSAFSHANWQHVLLNMLCFVIVSIYFERKIGSLGMLGFVIFSAYLSGIAVGTNNLAVNYHGFSGVNYLLYAYVIIDYIFSFRKERRNKTNTIMGSVIIVLIYLFMCFDGGTTGFSFKWYPADLMYNLGHYSSFVAGVVVGLFANIIKTITYKNMKKE